MRKTADLLTRLRRLRLLRWLLVAAVLPLASCQGVLDPQDLSRRLSDFSWSIRRRSCSSS
jgi:hypothetical protein